MSLSLSNNLCWNGSRKGYAKTVLPACDHAVDVAFEFTVAPARDSRGLARALTGDYDGAAEDFQFFVDRSESTGSYTNLIEQRQEWIEDLDAGQNPFDQETLDALPP